MFVLGHLAILLLFCKLHMIAYHGFDMSALFNYRLTCDLEIGNLFIFFGFLFCDCLGVKKGFNFFRNVCLSVCVTCIQYAESTRSILTKLSIIVSYT